MKTKTMHPFDIATNLTEVQGKFLGQTTTHYANMIGPFGGILAANLLKAILNHPERIGEPVSLTVNYVSAVADGSFEIRPSIARTNRSTQHWKVDMLQDNKVVMTGTALCAKRKTTWSNTELAMPEVVQPEAVKRFSLEGTPTWMQQYDMRFISGKPNVLGEKEDTLEHSSSLLWIKDLPDRPLDYLSLASLCDTFLPRIFLREPQFVPASTVSLTIYFHVNAEMLTQHGSNFVLGQARGHRFYNGFFDQFGTLWNTKGEILATTSQIVYFRD